MANETSFYFGAYLEIKTRPQFSAKDVRVCPDGHDTYAGGAYCPTCGEALVIRTEVLESHPRHVDDIIGDEWVDVMSSITPPKVSSTGTMLVIPNSLDADGYDWLYVSCRWGDGRPETLPFPTADEIQAMKSALREHAQDVIEALEESPLVISVEVKAGYVLDIEY